LKGSQLITQKKEKKTQLIKYTIDLSEMDSNDESDQFSTGSNGSSSTSYAAKTNHLDMQFMNKFITAAALQMCSYLQLLLLLYHLVPLLRSRYCKKTKRKPNVHRNQSSVIAFIHSWSDEKFKQQFCLTRQDFFLVESIILENMARKGYNLEKHNAFTTRSSVSPISLELRLYVTF
jgi:hypothetical protein